ncbi:hypothetical protein [Planomonospora sp. ID82291]|uniref:hypothetical protein n=1 Tax=Planomonospora sp. ID82291 TaxID=2738136 RepID=UPI0018C3D54B|nr:hypothetical protein [Planomonospora sp. ID82291]MBG0819149.1 hypothetical protein [Planomonospora sp. ID82291]
MKELRGISAHGLLLGLEAETPEDRAEILRIVQQITSEWEELPEMNLQEITRLYGLPEHSAAAHLQLLRHRVEEYAADQARGDVPSLPVLESISAALEGLQQATRDELRAMGVLRHQEPATLAEAPPIPDRLPSDDLIDQAIAEHQAAAESDHAPA